MYSQIKKSPSIHMLSIQIDTKRENQNESLHSHVEH